jgi:hypothetical protein
MKKNQIADRPGRGIDTREGDDNKSLDRRDCDDRIDSISAEGLQTRAGEKELAERDNKDRSCE